MATSDPTSEGSLQPVPLTATNASKPQSGPVAGVSHTLCLLVVLGVWAYIGRINAIHLRTVAHPNHLLIYGRTLVFEWVVFAYIVYGVRKHGVSLRELIGPRWTKPSEVFGDIGIALAFELCSLLVLGIVGHLLNAGSNVNNVRFMAPSGVAELGVWLLLSTTAGICEETIFRGYFQRQFISWTGNAVIGILISAALFGAGHIYQGAKQAIIIGIYGVMFGVLAWLRRSLKPGMIAHTFQDSAAGVALIMAARYKLGSL